MKHLNNEESESWKGPYRPLYQEIYGLSSAKVRYFCQFLIHILYYRGAHDLKLFSHFHSSETLSCPFGFLINMSWPVFLHQADIIVAKNKSTACFSEAVFTEEWCSLCFWNIINGPRLEIDDLDETPYFVDKRSEDQIWPCPRPLRDLEQTQGYRAWVPAPGSGIVGPSRQEGEAVMMVKG